VKVLRLWLAPLIAVAATMTLPLRGAAQEVLDQKSANEIRLQYLADLDTVHTKVMALAEAIPESKFGWRPTPETRSVSEAMMHLATEWYFWGSLAVGGKPPADFGVPRETIPKLEKVASKAEVIDHLKKSWAHCRAQIEGADPAKLTGRMKWFGSEATFPQIVLGMAGDMHEHLGQLVTYTRSVGVVPPWSRKSGG